MTTGIDRMKYMDDDEVRRLRTVSEARAILDLKAGRVGGVVGWMIVDLALQTGLRVSELVRLTVGDFDPKRKALRVWRHKRRKPVQETIAVGKALADHLSTFIDWKA